MILLLLPITTLFDSEYTFPYIVHKKEWLIGKLNCEQKKQITNSTVWNVALYAAETWTPNKASKTLLKAFEMWT